MGGGDLSQDRVVVREIALPEGAVAHDGHVEGEAVVDQAVLDPAVSQVIEDLVAGHALRASQGDRLVEQVTVEVRHAEGLDLALVHEPAEALHRVLEGVVAGGVEEVDVEPVGPETAQASIARLDGAPVGCVRGQHLRHEEDLVPPAEDGVADDLLDGPAAVHLGGVDVGHPQVKAPPQGGDRLLAVTFHRPGALADDGHHHPRRAEWSSLHVRSALLWASPASVRPVLLGGVGQDLVDGPDRAPALAIQ